MPSAAVVYRSRSGTTRRYAEEIGAHLASRGIQVTVASIGDCDMATLAHVDFLLLGCWTNGLLVLMQHPDGPWMAFARELSAAARPPSPEARPRVALFTTYKLLTGSMFAEMRRHLGGPAADASLELKSRDGHLTAAARRALDSFTGRGASG